MIWITNGILQTMNQPLKALIVDDEFAARDNLKSLLGMCCPDLQIIGMSENVSDAVLKIKELHPDIVFLDVEMPRYAGYEIVKFIDDINFHIIFVTAYDKYAIKAFQLNAIDYLLKPVDRHLLKEAVQKVVVKLKEKQAAESYTSLLQTIQEKENKTIVLNELNKRSIVALNDIIAIEAQGAYSHIHLLNGGTKIISKNIGHYEELLEDEPKFYRTHKSWLINTEKILSYSIANLTLELQKDVKAKLSRLKKTEFEQLIKEK